MKKLFAILLLLSASVSTYAQLESRQLEPTKEDIEKYDFLLKDISQFGQRNIPDTVIEKFDRQYEIDTNSLVLKLILVNTNSRLIFDSLRTDRIPQAIAIINSLLLMDTTLKFKLDAFFNLAISHKYLGHYSTAADYLKQMMQLFPGGNQNEAILNNLASVYDLDGQKKKALETIQLIPQSKWVGNKSTLPGIIYYHNGLHDSALILINNALSVDSNNYFAYAVKSKILLDKKAKTNACDCLTKAEEILKNDNNEGFLKTRGQNNPYIKQLLAEIEEIHELKRKNCR